MSEDCTSGIEETTNTTTPPTGVTTTTTTCVDESEMQQMNLYSSLMQADVSDGGQLQIVEDAVTDDDQPQQQLGDEVDDAGQCPPADGDLVDHPVDTACPSTSATAPAELPDSQAIVIQPCQMVVPSQSTDSVADAGSTIAATLQGLISPGSTVYTSSSSSTLEPDASSMPDHQSFAGTSPISIPPPIAILAPVDQRAEAQLDAVSGEGLQVEATAPSSATVVASRSQQVVCQLVQPSPQGLVAGQDGVMSPAGATVYGGGVTTETAAAVQSQIDVAMACQQQYLGSATIQTGQGFQAPVMALPQTLQVIQAAPQHQFVQQQCLQQQYMFQTNPVQIPGGVGVSAPRPVSKSSNVLPIAPQTSLSSRTSAASVVPSKGTAAVAPQPISVSKPQQQQPQLAQNSTSVLSQLGGMIQNTGVAQQMILPQQQQQQPRAISLCQVNQPINLGPVGSQLQFGQPVNLGPVNPTLNFGQAGQPVALGQVNQTLNLSQVNQVIGSPGQIRFTAMPNFGFNAAGQLVGGAQTLLNFQNVPVMQQPLLSSQPTTILGSQPLYIRTAEPFVQQQTPSFAVANVQAVTPIRNVVIPQSTQSSTSSRRLQVQPNNAIAPSTTSSSKPPSITTASSVSKSTPKPNKPLVPATSMPSVLKSVAPATTAQSRPVKPLPTLAVTPKTTSATQQSSSSSLTAVVNASTVSASGTKTTSSSVAASKTSTSSVSTAVVTTATAVSSTSVAVTSTLSTTTATTMHQDSAKTFPTAKPAEDKSKPVPDKNVSTVANQEKKCEEKPGVVSKSSGKSKKPKILTHVIEGFIIQEASEPFPVQNSSLISQIWSPKVPSTTDDGYSSPKSEKETDDDDTDDLKSKEYQPSESKKPKLDSESAVFTKSEELSVTRSPPSTQPTVSPPETEARLTCEFCGKSDFIYMFARSRRFCSVTCSKRFSAYSMRKAPDGSVTGRPTSTPKRSRGSSAQSRTAVTSSATATVDSKEALQSSLRLPDPRVTAIKASATVCSSESDDTDMSNGAGTSSQAGDSSPGSQSPPALERVERINDKELSEDGVLIPPRPLAQWNVQDVYDFIRTLPGCSMYADEFRQQEIDGSALMLLKEDHLMMTMNVKLGPALKICSRISSLKE